MGLGVRGVKGLGDLDARGRLIKHKLLFVQHAKSGGAWRGGGETGAAAAALRLILSLAGRHV